MPGWNGAGVFVLPYSMVAEAASGVKILASHQDTQWNAVKAGLELCLTRDGQNSPSADISWATHKITNLGTPVLGTDAVTKDYVDTSGAGEWQLETYSVAWVSATKFKVNGTNATARYAAGRRVKVVYASGASTLYGTVVSSSFSIDTTVTIISDNGQALSAVVTAVSFGQLAYSNPAYLDPRTAVLGYKDGPSLVTATSARVALNGELTDSNGEFNPSTYKFTARYPGNYLVGGAVTYLVTTGGTAYCQIRKSGSNWIETYQILAVSASFQTVHLPSRVFTIDAGEEVDLWASGIVGTIEGDIGSTMTCLSVARIP